MSAVFEFLFCPIHGLLRPDMFMAMLAAAQQSVAEISFYLRRAGLL
jgi:hypothetical protein